MAVWTPLSGVGELALPPDETPLVGAEELGIESVFTCQTHNEDGVCAHEVLLGHLRSPDSWGVQSLKVGSSICEEVTIHMKASVGCCLVHALDGIHAVRFCALQIIGCGGSLETGEHYTT